MVNLVNLLIERGLITHQDGAQLIQQAEEEAASATAEAQRDPPPAEDDEAKRIAAAKEIAAIQIESAKQVAAIQIAAAREIAAIQGGAKNPAPQNASEVAQRMPPASAASNASQQTAATETTSPATQPVAETQSQTSPNSQSAAKSAPATDDAVHVTYVPEIVKEQIREEVKEDVMAQARQENWASPRTMPDWVSRFRPLGDIRIRYEGSYYPSGNDNTGAFPNFNAINTGSPFDVSNISNPNFSPQYNVDQPRNRVRLRARLGTAVDLGENFAAGFRIGTGENNSPVTENQTLGAANSAQGGNFSKYSLWLDRAFLRYEVGGQPDKDLSVTIGRFDNPFFATSMIWADDLGFDGAVVQGKYPINEDITPFLVVGAFPVFNTDLNFATNQPAKFKSEDKWLYAAQLGTSWEISQDFSTKIGVAYYDFDNIEGRLSSPFTPLSSSDIGDTDDTRPAFAQKGNTYMALRDIVASSLNNSGTTSLFQYFGLATPFRDLAVTAQLDYDHFEPFQVSLFGEYAKNLAFDRTAIDAKAVNNLDGSGNFAGGDAAWIAGIKIGHAALEKRWDWNVNFNYRHVESDAVVDGFCDSDFGGGGTNLKGYTVASALALSKRVWLGLRWMSADSIAGPIYKNDILQFDINGKL